jgi:hypothetical protein
LAAVLVKVFWRPSSTPKRTTVVTVPAPPAARKKTPAVKKPIPPPTPAKQENGAPQPPVAPAAAAVTSTVAVPAGELRFSDDTEQKSGDFWLEQTIDLPSPPPQGGAADNRPLVDLYVALDGQTWAGTRIRLSRSAVVLESVPGGGAPTGVEQGARLAGEPLPSTALGLIQLGALWRRGELSVWCGPRQVLQWRPGTGKASNGFARPSAVHVLGEGIRLGERRTVPLSDIRFDDNFMRDTAGGTWQPLAGKWELTALAFPERSANPFSLRVAFGADQPADDRLYQGRTRGDDYGLGILLSAMEGTLHIARITGGSPAAHAGLAEDDILLEVNGQRVWEYDPRRAIMLLVSHWQRDVRLKVLRPGEKAVREFQITRDHYRWGTPAEGIAIPPERTLETAGTDRVALIAAGETGWSDYAVEVAAKSLGAGGMGVAVGVLSAQDYVVFRWRGFAASLKPQPEGLKPGAADKLQLVRVAGGKETVLAEREGGYRPYEFYRLGMDWKGETVACSVDGSEVLRATVPELKRGQVGLYALQGDAVFFDDVRVYTNREALAAAQRPEQALNRIFAAEEHMDVWANPALEWQRDLQTGWAVHQQRFPGTQAVVLQKPRFTELTVAQHWTEGATTTPGPTLVIKDGQATLAGGGRTASARVGAGPFARIAFSERAADVDGARLTLPAPEGVAEPGAGTLLAIRGLKNLGDPNTARVSSSNVLEYSFTGAPTDWKVDCGRWGLLNKWICDPRWSWFGGRTRTLASLWNKHVFSGDVSVDAYVSLMMQHDDPPFERPGDYNITLCGDGVNLDSGYTLIFGGDNNSWTRLYRKGKLVAESAKEEHRLTNDRTQHPDKPDLHLRWFHVKLEKIGNTVSFYRDNVRAFSFADPEPLAEGRVAFWTLDNGFLLSRVRIAHNGAKAAPFEPRRTSLHNDARVVNVFDGEVWTKVEPQNVPAEIAAALGAPKNAFRPADADALPAERAAVAPNAETAPAYRVANGTGGGPFALQWKNVLVDPDTRGVVRFAYRIEPGAMVDLYLIDVSGRPFDPRRMGAYRWRLTGPRESDECAPLVGEVPGVQADGRWHAVQFDLQPSWRALWKQRGYKHPTQRALRLMIGNLSNQGYLLAGMNGNHAGAAYSVSNIALYAARDVDAEAPVVARVVWPYDADGDGRSVQVIFNDPGGSGVDESSLQAALNGASLPREALAFDPLRQALRLDLPALNMAPLTTTPDLRLDVAEFQDRARNRGEKFSASYRFDAQAAAKAGRIPAAPLVSVGGAGEAAPGAEALRLPGVAAVAPAARLQQSEDAPPWAPRSERRSVQVVATSDGSAFGFQLPGLAYRLSQWPYLELEYKLPPETPANLSFFDDSGRMRALVLGDTGDALDPLSDEAAGRVGPPAEFICDGTWRRTTVPLQRLLAAQDARLATSVLRNFSLQDLGWRGNRRGMEYWIHRVQPLAAGRTGDLWFTWLAADASGITGYASCIDQKADGNPGQKQEVAPRETLAAALERRGGVLPDGWHYLHVRVKNGAGVWSETGHARFCVDNTGPKVARTSPAAGSTYEGQTIRVYLDEPHGVDAAAIQMLVNGQAVAARFLSYDGEANCIVYDAWAAGARWPDKAAVTVELQGLRDLLGNQSAPVTFSFQADSSSGDKEGPAITQMRFVAPTLGVMRQRQMDMEISFGVDFEEHRGQVYAMRDCRMEWLDDAAQAAFGRRAAQFTALDDDADVQIMLHKNPWHLDRGPLLQFDYKAEPGMRVDLLAEVLGQWLCVQFTGDGAAPPEGKAIGQIEAVIADGSWRHASVDLRSLVNAAWPDLPVRIVNKIVLSAQGRDGCRRGARLTLDNVDICRPVTPGAARFEWRAAARGEVAGYSCVVDQNAGTVPPEQITQIRTTATLMAHAGVWYLHVRACDQAGRWGPPRTMRVEVGKQ